MGITNDEVTWLAFVGALVATLGTAAALAGRGGGARFVVRLLAGSALVQPLFVPKSPAWIAAFFTLAAAFGAATVVDLDRDPAGLSLPKRVLHVFALYDTRLDRAIARHFDARRLLEAIAFLAATTATLIAALEIGTATYGALALRWLLAAAFGYSAWGALTAMVHFVAHARGLDPAPFHVRPILSLSIAEFWNRRWNRVVGAWLERTFYRPLAKRRHPRLGVVATFLASAALHMYFIWVPLGWKWAAVMGGFFVLQIPYVFVERWLRATRWSVGARRAWTVGLLLVASPLHMEPCLQLAQRAAGASIF